MSQLPKQIINLIESLNEDQLHALYRVIAERLNLIHKARALVAMRNFYILDRVSFTNKGKRYESVVTRLNQKTITVTLDNGTRWGISPENLKKVDQKNLLKELLTPEQRQKMNKKNLKGI